VTFHCGGRERDYPQREKVTYQYANRPMATDTKPRAGVESSTTEDICNGTITDGNECQDIALFVASSRLHGGKPNRIRSARLPSTYARSN
jgi:hypothetical protein